MTNQNPADAVREAPSIEEAIRVFDQSSARTYPNKQTASWEVLRAHIAALTARVAAWDEFAQAMFLGTPIWPNQWPQEVAMIAWAIHIEREKAEAHARDAERLLAAADDYYLGYCQDEANDDIDGDGKGHWTGCDRRQRDAARELHDAVKAMKEPQPK